MDEYFQEIENTTLPDYNTPLQVLHYKIEEALRAPILHSGLCNTRMFARAMGLATRASLIQYYWVECRCSAPAFSPSTEERAPSTRWKEALAVEREVAEKVAAMVAVMVVEVRVVARAAVMVEVVRVVVPAEVMVEAVMEVVPTKVNPRTTQKMMMSQVSTSSIYTDLFSDARHSQSSITRR